MAESKPSDGSSTSDVCGGSESTLQINIKTLDSQIYRFRVDKNVISYLSCDNSADNFILDWMQIREAWVAYFILSYCLVPSK